MRLSRNFKTACGHLAGATAALSLLVGCAGGQGAHRSVAPEDGPAASRTRLPVRTGAEDVVHTALNEKTYGIRLAVKSLVRGSRDDLDGVRVSGELKGKIPYYLTYEVTNTGTKKIPAAYEVFRNLALIGTDWTPAAQVESIGSGIASPCPDTSPDALAPGDSYTTCGTYMMTKGVGAMTVTHSAGAGFITPADGVAAWPVDGGLATASKELARQGDTIAVRWDAGKDDGGVLELPATLKYVREGDPADLAGLGLDEDQEGRVPYYVAISYRNTGGKDLYPGQSTSVRLLTASGQQLGGAPGHLLDRPEVTGCPKADLSDTWAAPGATVTQCTVHLAAKGDEPVAVGFEQAGEEEFTGWRARVS
ncbi:hypothetical protein [Streptomyces sp. NPDC046939]|uniref:hypothetical protein n=1 Tax=Streptomyces sp. NPDC046939 TaxID=3155376 RepID=UPI0033FC2C05